MYPSRLRISAMRSLILERGMVVVTCLAIAALRSRVSMSATGSVIMDGLPSVLGSESQVPALLPARLGHAGDLPEQRQLTEADAAQREFAHVRARPAAAAAPVAELNRKLGGALPLLDLALLRHVVVSLKLQWVSDRGRPPDGGGAVQQAPGGAADQVAGTACPAETAACAPRRRCERWSRWLSPSPARGRRGRTRSRGR